MLRSRIARCGFGEVDIFSSVLFVDENAKVWTVYTRKVVMAHFLFVVAGT